MPRTADMPIRNRELRLTILGAWLALLAAPVALAIGHWGANDLDWLRHHVSTYAALAPHRAWVTAAMWLAALALICMGLAMPLRHTHGPALPDRIASMVTGAAAFGLLMLAHYREAAASLMQLRTMGFDAIRQQSFHDAGLLLFFDCSILALAISGLLVVWRGPGWRRRVLGGIIASSGGFAVAAIASSWPAHLGIAAPFNGLKQRAAFLCLWLGAVLLLGLMTRSLPGDAPSGTLGTGQ